MSDTGGRPIWSSLPGEEPGFRLAGSPIIIASQMPDVMAGSTPVAFGNWKRTYTCAWRKAPTMQIDNSTTGWCTVFKFEARCGGATTCPNSARLLRVR
jgi:HK97 family phage major capsid protein